MVCCSYVNYRKKAMSQKIFITYANEKFALSEKQVLKEAEALGFFDRCIGYTPKDLPEFMRANPLMGFARGGGYWCWKPYVIWKTLQDYPNAIVVYADAGCKVQTGAEWSVWFEMMEKYDTLLQCYRDGVDYGWEQLYPGRKVGTPINHWAKKSLLDYFDPCFVKKDWHKQPSLWAGFVIAKGSSRVIKEWFEMVQFHPYLFFEPFGSEVYEQKESYIEHRHDQSVLTAIALLGMEKGWNIKVLPEVSESREDAAIVTMRRVVRAESTSTKLSNWLKSVLGENLYRRLHPKK